MILKGNYIFVRPDQKRFEISSNFTNYIELGSEGITDYYLEAMIVNNEFKISGKLFNKNGEIVCKSEDFINSRECNKEKVPYGFLIKDKDNNLILEIKIEDDICHLKGTIYDELGDIVAQYRNDHFMILKGPAIIGKSGEAIGMRIATKKFTVDTILVTE